MIKSETMFGSFFFLERSEISRKLHSQILDKLSCKIPKKVVIDHDVA